jgi:hypothetical protein
MDIRIDDLSGPEIACLLDQYIEEMKELDNTILKLNS